MPHKFQRLRKTLHASCLTCSKILPLIVYTFLIFSFYSCSDDSVTPPADDFDPPRFNWRAESIYYYGFAGMWAMDTSKIFLLNHYNRNLYIVSGGNTTMQYIGGYYLNEIKGLSNNEVYIFATGFDGYMTLIKWNGAGFEYYPTDIFVTGFGLNFVRGCTVNSNEIWILSWSGICKFDGSKMTDYSYEDSLLNPPLIPEDLFLSNENKVQYMAIRFIDTAYTQQALFEFRDTGFVRIYNDIRSPYPTGSFTSLQEVGGYKFGMEKNYSPPYLCIDNFNGTSFTNYFCFNNKIRDTWCARIGQAGVNLQNFMTIAQATESIFDISFFGKKIKTNFGILHWNGSKASKEIGTEHICESPYEASILFSINSNSYLFLQPSNINQQDILYIGTKK